MDILLCLWCTPQEDSQHLTPLLATERLTHWHIVVYMWVKWTGSSLIQIMACCLFGSKPFPIRLQVYCQLDTWVKFKLKYHNCPLHKYSWHVKKFLIFPGLNVIIRIESYNPFWASCVQPSFGGFHGLLIFLAGFHTDLVHSSSSSRTSLRHSNPSGYGLTQWEMTLHCDIVPHWLRPYPEWSL